MYLEELDWKNTKDETLKENSLGSSIRFSGKLPLHILVLLIEFFEQSSHMDGGAIANVTARDLPLRRTVLQKNGKN